MSLFFAYIGSIYILAAQIHSHAFELGEDVGNVPYKFFLETSKFLDNISLIEEHEFVSCANRTPSRASSRLRENLISQTLQEAPQMDHFFHLPLDEAEKKIIISLITTMAEKNVIKLGLMRKTLERKGKRIHHVHPLRFLDYIFSTPHLKSSMHKIRRSSFKWDGFIEGLSKKMKDESISDNLIRYVPGFSQSLNVNSEHVMSYIHKQDWEGLVRFLL
jgi:hypothetical protein